MGKLLRQRCEQNTNSGRRRAHREGFGKVVPLQHLGVIVAKPIDPPCHGSIRTKPDPMGPANVSPQQKLFPHSRKMKFQNEKRRRESSFRMKNEEQNKVSSKLVELLLRNYEFVL